MSTIGTSPETVTVSLPASPGYWIVSERLVTTVTRELEDVGRATQIELVHAEARAAGCSKGCPLITLTSFFES